MTAKRRLSNSFLEGDLSSALSNRNHQLKKIKVDNASGQDSDPVHTELRSAIRIKKAVNRIHKLPQLGYCPTKAQQFHKKNDQLDNRGDPHGEFRGSKKSKRSAERFTNRGFLSRDLANQVIINELRTLHKDMRSHACGEFDESDSFHLCITRPGCEFNGHIGRDSSEVDRLLPSWFDHSAISGMQSMETRVDPEVRNARHIPASKFKVEPNFLEQIQELWGKHFLPRNVLAEPYKIHLYGPGGCFKSFGDAPETGLVGTVLIGLGDTSRSSTSDTSSQSDTSSNFENSSDSDTSSTAVGHFRTGDKTLRAERGNWVAFRGAHPDIPREVTEPEDGYLAVMSFKIFNMADDEPDVLSAQLKARMKSILDQISVPFGLFMAHQYSTGTTSLNEFDILLSTYAHSRNDTQAHILPVVTEFHGEANESEAGRVTKSHVYPFTGAHVDILLENNVVRAKKEVQWLDGLSDIPFYAWDIRASLEAWKEDYPDAGYADNEAQREDSIYLSYAVLFLPQLPNHPRK